MDNSKYGIPSAEWNDYDAAHPELRINEEGKDDWSTFPTPVALRDVVNSARLQASRANLAASGLDKKVRIESHDVPVRDGSTIPARVYRLAGGDRSTKPRPGYLFYHGGGMIFGTPEGEDFSCSGYVDGFGREDGGLVVINVCYRHAPEFTHPTQVHDAWDAFEWVLANVDTLGVDPAKLVVGGISAGGLLTASVGFAEAALAKKEGRPLRMKGQLLAIPWLVHRDVFPYELFASKEKASIEQCADAPIMPQQRYNMFVDLFKSDGKEPVYGLASDEELQGTPKTALMVNGWDILRDESFISPCCFPSHQPAEETCWKISLANPIPGYPSRSTCFQVCLMLSGNGSICLRARGGMR
jgi:acetyl esterase/lipase